MQICLIFSELWLHLSAVFKFSISLSLIMFVNKTDKMFPMNGLYQYISVKSELKFKHIYVSMYIWHHQLI